MFRFKDIKNWWKNDHFDRPGAVENTTKTAWVKESKPFWMMELGCPASDKAANQPNVFFDPKSSESQLPFFSNGNRDDLMQRRYITAFLRYWDESDDDFVEANNPQSSVYTGRMVDTERVFIYTWDARPYPAFPNLGDVWADGDNWEFGHWITGRVSDAPVGEAIGQIFTDYGFTDVDIDPIIGVLGGYVIERNMAPREAIQPLETAFFFDAVETGEKLAIRARLVAESLGSVDQDGVIDTGSTQPRITLTRAQETELPGRARINFFKADGDYKSTNVETLKLTGGSDRVSSVSLPAIATKAKMRAHVEMLLREQWRARERLAFTLPPTLLKAEPGDLITVGTGAREIQRADHPR